MLDDQYVVCFGGAATYTTSERLMNDRLVMNYIDLKP